jgi:hypothetical protein
VNREDKMKRTVCYLATFAGIALLLAGCSTQSRLEMDYGTSYKLAIMNQTLDPKAEKSLEPVYGLEGRIAQKVMDKYGKEFEKAAPPPTYILNLGSGGQ